MLFRWQAAEGWPIVLVSQNVVQFGYTPEELLEGPVRFASIVHPEDLDRVGREVQGYTANGADRFEQEYRIVAKDGQVRWVDDRTVVERTRRGGSPTTRASWSTSLHASRPRPSASA